MMIEKNVQKITYTDKLFSILIVLLPFLYQYKGLGNILSFGELLLCPVLVALVIPYTSGRLKNCDGWLFMFYAVTFTTTLACALFAYFQMSTAMTVLVRMVFYAVIIYIAKDHFILGYAKKVYYFVSFAFSVYLIIQYLYYYATGGYLPIYLNYSWLFGPEARGFSLTKYFQWGFRASSLFLEPSYFSLFVLPCVSLLLYEKNKSVHKIIALVVICIALAFSTANSGIVGMVLIFTIYLLGNTSEKSAKNSIIRVFIAVMAFLMIAGYLFLAENASYFLGRLQSGGSFYQRIIRGFIIFDKLPAIHKMIGVGVNNIESYMIAHNLSTIYDEKNLNYCSSIVQTLNYSGILGFSVLLGYFANLYRKIRKSQSVLNETHISNVYQHGVLTSLYVVILFITGYEAILFTYRFAFMIIILQGCQKEIDVNYIQEGLPK